MGAMSELDIVAQEHGIDVAAPDALIRALDVIRELDEIIDAASRPAPRRPRKVYPKCIDPECGHSVRSHNDLGYCQAGAGTMRGCACKGCDDGRRRQPDGTWA